MSTPMPAGAPTHRPKARPIGALNAFWQAKLARAVYCSSMWPASLAYTSPKVRARSFRATSIARRASETSSAPSTIRQPWPAPPLVSRASSIATTSVLVALTASSIAMMWGPAPVRPPKIPIEWYLGSRPMTLCRVGSTLAITRPIVSPKAVPTNSVMPGCWTAVNELAGGAELPLEPPLAAAPTFCITCWTMRSSNFSSMFIHSLPLYWLMVCYRLSTIFAYESLGLGQQKLGVGVRSRDDMDRDDLAHALGGGGAGVGGGFHRTHIASHHHGDETRADLLHADQRDVGGFDHGVGGLDDCHQPFGLDQAQSFTLRIRHRDLLLSNDIQEESASAC